MIRDTVPSTLLAQAAPPLGGHPFVLPTARRGDELWVSGQVPFGADGELLAVGTVGTSIGLDAARQCARQCALNVLARACEAAGSLEALNRVLRVTVYVAADAGFRDHPQVADAASAVFVEALGDRGQHARAAIGVSSLPLGVPVEVEALMTCDPSVGRGDAPIAGDAHARLTSTR